MNNLKTAYIVDIDGLLSDSEVRTEFEREVENDDFEWFEDRIPNFPANRWAVELVRALARDHTILFITARSEKYRHNTVRWLKNHVGVSSYKLLMRHRKGDDIAIKKELYQASVEGRFRVLAAFDDRRCCIEMWRGFGIVALHSTDNE